METKKIGIASDHAGYEMKEFLIGYLESKGYEVYDFGAPSAESFDYPDSAHPLACAVEKGELSMTLNKHQGIRAALCWTPELAELARRHNDANICSLPARFIDNTQAAAIVDAYLGAEFEGGRHQRRIDKIPFRGTC